MHKVFELINFYTKRITYKAEERIELVIVNREQGGSDWSNSPGYRKHMV